MNLIERDALYRDAIARHREWAKNNPELYTSAVQGNFANLLHDTARSLSLRMANEADTYYAESVEIWRQLAKGSPLHSIFHRRLAATLQNFARHHRWHAANKKSAENADQRARRLALADALFQEAIKVERQLTAEFPDVKTYAQRMVGPHPLVLANLLQEQANFVLKQVAEEKPNTSMSSLHAERKREADALLVEAIILRRQIAAEFPDNADYKSRLDDLLKLQAQHFGQKPDTKPDQNP